MRERGREEIGRNERGRRSKGSKGIKKRKRESCSVRQTRARWRRGEAERPSGGRQRGGGLARTEAQDSLRPRGASVEARLKGRLPSAGSAVGAAAMLTQVRAGQGGGKGRDKNTCDRFRHASDGNEARVPSRIRTIAQTHTSTHERTHNPTLIHM